MRGSERGEGNEISFDYKTLSSAMIHKEINHDKLTIKYPPFMNMWRNLVESAVMVTLFRADCLEAPAKAKGVDARYLEIVCWIGD
jgi:hypothetical protein